MDYKKEIDMLKAQVKCLLTTQRYNTRIIAGFASGLMEGLQDAEKDIIRETQETRTGSGTSVGSGEHASSDTKCCGGGTCKTGSEEEGSDGSVGGGA